jgi:hypothetical protein
MLSVAVTSVVRLNVIRFGVVVPKRYITFAYLIFEDVAKILPFKCTLISKFSLI